MDGIINITIQLNDIKNSTMQSLQQKTLSSLIMASCNVCDISNK